MTKCSRIKVENKSTGKNLCNECEQYFRCKINIENCPHVRRKRTFEIGICKLIYDQIGERLKEI